MKPVSGAVPASSPRSRPPRTGLANPRELALILTGAALFLAIGFAAMTGLTTGLDSWGLELFRLSDDAGRTVGPQWLVRVMLDLSTIGGIVVLALLTAITVLYLAYRGRVALALAILATELGGVALTTILKILFNRTRPDLVPQLTSVHDASFPSGHSMMSAVTYLTLAALLTHSDGRLAGRRFIWAIGLALPLAIGLSRVFLGVHFPSDVLGGWCLGVTWAFACWTVWRRFLPPAPPAAEN